MSQSPVTTSGQPRETSHQTSFRSRELMIQEYISAARARLEATNASLPNLSGTAYPAPKSSGTPSSATASSGTNSSSSTDSADTTASSNTSSADTPSTSAHSATSSSKVPVRRAPFPDTTQDRGRSSPIQTASRPNRATGAEWPLPQKSRHPSQSSQGTPRSAGPRNQNYPLFGRQAIRGASDYHSRQQDYASAANPGRGRIDRNGNPIPAQRSHHGQHMKYSYPVSNPGASRSYFPPPNIRPQPNSPLPAASSSAPPAASTRFSPPEQPVARSTMTQVAQIPSVPVIPEEPDRHKSIRSSVVSSNATDLLYEASDGGRVNSGISEFLAGYADRDSSTPVSESNGAGHVREASVGQVQKPVVTQVTPRKDEKGEMKDRSIPIIAVEEVQIPEYPNSSLVEPVLPPQGIAKQTPNDEDLVPALEPRALQTPARSVSRESPKSDRNDDSPDAKPARKSLRNSRSRSPLLPVASRFSQTVTQPDTTADAEAEAHKTSDSPPLGAAGVRRGNRKPQSLDVAALMEGDIRASTTSLKGLILRNLRLASNLERGVTSSKFGLDWIINAQDGNEKPGSRESQASMLNEFPATPTPGSPHVGQGLLPQSDWAEVPDPATAGQEPTTKRRARKYCCGLSLWALILIIVSLVLLIAAAIIIPILLIVVLPHQNQHKSQPAVCRQHLVCSNGGSAISTPADGPCSCLCANGWTGVTCTVLDTTNCTTTDLSHFPNLTIGSAIPNLFTIASTNFDISLDAVTILSLFSKNNMTCTSENSLVSFPGLVSRSSRARIRARASFSPDGLDARHLTASKTVGIMYAPAPTKRPAASSKTGSSHSKATGVPKNFVPTSQQNIDVARAAVLHIFQSSTELSVALFAHSWLQAYFESPGNANPKYLDVGNGWIVDLVDKTLWFNGVSRKSS